jgi:hypothetical protein
MHSQVKKLTFCTQNTTISPNHSDVSEFCQSSLFEDMQHPLLFGLKSSIGCILNAVKLAKKRKPFMNSHFIMGVIGEQAQ